MLLPLSVLLTGCGKTTAGSVGESEQFTARSIVFDCYSEQEPCTKKTGLLLQYYPSDAEKFIIIYLDYESGKIKEMERSYSGDIAVDFVGGECAGFRGGNTILLRSHATGQ